MRIACLVAAVAAASLPLRPASGAEAEELKPDFVFRDFLGYRWENECVRFRVTDAQWRQAQAGHALADDQGRALPYQTVSGEKRSSFQAVW